MFNRTEKDEKQFLKEVKATLLVELQHMSGRVSRRRAVLTLSDVGR